MSIQCHSIAWYQGGYMIYIHNLYDRTKPIIWSHTHKIVWKLQIKPCLLGLLLMIVFFFNIFHKIIAFHDCLFKIICKKFPNFDSDKSGNMFFFMNVTKLDPFGKIFLRINMKLILLLQTWTKFLVFLETISDLFIFFVVKISFTPLNFNTKDPPFLVLRSLLK